MIRFLIIAVLATCASATDQPPAPLAVHRGKTVDFASAPSGAITGPTKCDDSGTIYFRQYKAKDAYGSPILKLDPRENQSLLIDVSAIKDSSIPKASTLKFVDFSASAGTIYVAATDEDAKAYVVRLSADDGAVKSVIPLEDKFYPFKIAAFSSGALAVAGVKTIQKPDSTTALLSDMVLIDTTGRIAKHLHAGDWGGPTGNQTVENEGLDNLSLSLMEGSGASAYLIQSSAPATLTVVGEDGTVQPARKLWSPGEDFTAFNVRGLGTSVLVEYVKDLRGSAKDSGTVTEFVLYDLSVDQPVLIYRQDQDLAGAFACYDWRDGFTFVSNHAGHAVLISGSTK